MFELISYSIIYSRHLYYDHIFKINSEINIRKFRRLERWRDGSLQRSDYPRARCMGYDVDLRPCKQLRSKRAGDEKYPFIRKRAESDS